MKKTFNFLLIFFTVFFIINCKKESNKTNENSSVSQFPKTIKWFSIDTNNIESLLLQGNYYLNNANAFGIDSIRVINNLFGSSNFVLHFLGKSTIDTVLNGDSLRSGIAFLDTLTYFDHFNYSYNVSTNQYLLFSYYTTSSLSYSFYTDTTEYNLIGIDKNEYPSIYSWNYRKNQVLSSNKHVSEKQKITGCKSYDTIEYQAGFNNVPLINLVTSGLMPSNCTSLEFSNVLFYILPINTLTKAKCIKSISHHIYEYDGFPSEDFYDKLFFHYTYDAHDRVTEVIINKNEFDTNNKVYRYVFEY